MIQFSSFVWLLGIFFAFFGVLRGVNQELKTFTGLIFANLLLIQTDSLLRGQFLSLVSSQRLIVQLVVFVLIILVTYQSTENRLSDTIFTRTSVLGMLVGFANGVLIATTLWYLLDINEYPFGDVILPPAPGSASAVGIQFLPLLLLSQGNSQTSEIFSIVAMLAILAMLVIP